MPSSSSASEGSESDSSSGNVKRTRKTPPVARREVANESPDDPAVAGPANPGDENPGAEPGDPDATRKDEYSFELSRRKSKKLRKLMFEGVSSAEAKVLRNRFTPIFRKKSVKLQIPELDEAMYRRLKSLKNSTASKALIDPQEKSLSALQYKIIDIARPLLFLWENKQADSASREAVRTAVKR